MRVGRLLQLLRRRQDGIDIAAGLTMSVQLPHRHNGEGSRRGRLRRRLKPLATGHKETKNDEQSRFHAHYIVKFTLSLPDHFSYCQDSWDEKKESPWNTGAHEPRGNAFG